MSKKILFLVTIASAVIFTSCSKKLTALDAAYIKTNPNPLEMKAGEVNATVTGTFPQKYFNKKAVVTVTPVLKYGNKETKAQSAVFQGEKVLGNDRMISYKAGGTYEMNPKFMFDPEMAKSELYLNFDVAQKKKTYKLPALKIADGVISTAYLASTSPKELQPALSPDNFQRITQENQDADILFLIQQAQLRNSELNKDDIKQFSAKVKDARDAQNKEISSLEVLGYASPDGSLDLNTNLAEKRQKVTTDYINKELKKLQANVSVDSKFTAEDWDGFQKLMEASNIQDKDLILRVLSMYQDPEQREREIKNLASTFQSIAGEILPQLRRSRLKMSVDVTGKSDAEIMSLASTSPKDLTANELLYAGTLATTTKEQADIYENFIDLHPEDARGYNNLGLMLYYDGDVKEAERLFEKSLSLNPASPDANFNLGLVKLGKGLLTDAQAFFGKSAGTAGNLNAALGTSYIAQGDYTKALNVMRGSNTNNAALVQILNNDYNGARNTLAAVKNPNALTAYLGAILAARTNDRDTVYSNLRSAVQQDRTLIKKALNDLEFAKYFADANFLSILK
ncbi:MAG: tetratricopeptide repeat protein [Bacteroidia bacterium]|nr:tetratricopeptide repeat protein [Bacteroidia bacterium]HRG04064.1 tetratricopeptide repeat protein [Paludibacteraceae bacterium]